MPPRKSVSPMFPDYLPYFRLGGPMCSPGVLRAAKGKMVLEIPKVHRQRFTGKEIVDFRMILDIDVPKADRKSDSQYVPGEIIARASFGSYTLEIRDKPKWVDYKGRYVNATPFDLSRIFINKEEEDGCTKCELEIEVDIPGQPSASAIANIFMSRFVKKNSLRKTILAAEPLSRSLIEKKQASLADSDIDSWIVSLKCPLLSTRMTTPVRFGTCHHLECFDLDAFIDMELLRPKGRCPICYGFVETRYLAVCAFTMQILKENLDCESYEISQTAIRPISKEEKEEAVAPRKRKHVESAEALEETENQQAPRKKRSQLARPPLKPNHVVDDCIVLSDD